MRLLLDTHILLWALQASPKLTSDVVDQITDTANTVYVSAASAWEIAIKSSIGKLTPRDDLREQLIARQFSELDITFRHVLVAGKLPRHHNDPFDRLLIAQALVDDLVLVTQDEKFENYDVELLKN